MIAEQQFIQKRVTYPLEAGGRLLIIENVPARVCLETGECFFAPDTVERLQQLVWSEAKPVRTIETPVFEFTG